MVLSHQKPSIFASIFHSIFMFFPNPLPEGIFRGSKSQSSLKSAILERSAISQGAENGPIFPNNISKNHEKATTPNSGKRPGADLGAKWRRKRSKVVFSSIWARFLSICDGFWTIFNELLMLVFKNSTKNDPRSMKIRPWSVFG